MLQVLVDADNVAPRRLQRVLDVLKRVAEPVRMVASGRPQALARLTWPDDAELIATAGWQHADLALAEAYELNDERLVLISGDGDFGLLVTRHPGPVLVVSGAASGRLRDGTTVIDPATDGVATIQAWLRSH